MRWARRAGVAGSLLRREHGNAVKQRLAGGAFFVCRFGFAAGQFIALHHQCVDGRVDALNPAEVRLDHLS
jgi:hypothetical protein